MTFYWIQRAKLFTQVKRDTRKEMSIPAIDPSPQDFSKTQQTPSL